MCNIYLLSFLGRHYSLQYPNNEFKTGRNLRMSPIYPKLKEAGAVFEQVMGYERPTWFEPELVKGLLYIPINLLMYLLFSNLFIYIFFSTFV